MKRTNLVLDEQVLEEATRELGLKTYSATVNYALKEALRMRKVEGLAEFHGSNLWRGNLTEMRADRTVRLRRRRK
jgi:Arc/MetJ family transcription regulator